MSGVFYLRSVNQISWKKSMFSKDSNSTTWIDKLNKFEQFLVSRFKLVSGNSLMLKKYYICLISIVIVKFPEKRFLEIPVKIFFVAHKA